MHSSDQPVSRRTFLKRSAALTVGSLALAEQVAAATPAAAPNPAPHQAVGTRVGEVTATSAIVWTRLTAASTRNATGEEISALAKDLKGRPLPRPSGPVDALHAACPGAAGRVRLRYGPDASLAGATTTPWLEVTAEHDFIHHFRLTDLRPGTVYHYASESTGPGGQPIHAAFRGRFETAPPAEAPAVVRFCVMTCQGYPDRGHVDGHPIYPSMLALKPQFACLTGDLVYYDNDMPRATSARLARYHWERMFSLPRLIEFNRNVGTYWLKDDHDTLKDDAWSGQRQGELTFDEGQRIFREQAPMADGPAYRTFRWGRDLQIWLTEGRDFRSDNTMPDGPGKTIWGAEQKAWFKRTVLESDATWKVLVSPTPLVGPDRPQGKNDNHSNAGFRHEGDELRAWLREHVPDNFFVICGDRHWQYHSVHPETGLREFSVGAASDEHAGGSPGEDLRYHRFHRVQGGFLSAEVRRAGAESEIAFRLHTVHGAISHEASFRRPVA
jgi:alkaline phosphatase D